MAERDYLSSTKEADIERSSEDIRQDIAKGEENISQTVEQIGERIKEKLDWHEYVKDSPYLAIGVAAGLGYLASGMFITRTTPMERIMGSIAGEVRDSIGGRIAGSAGYGLIRMTLKAVVLKAAAGWINNAISTTEANSSTVPRPMKEYGSTIIPKADSQES